MSIALMLMLAMPTFMVAVPTVDALDIPTFAMLTAAPNPVGVNQVVYINAFMTRPTPTAGMANSGDQYENITVEITHPDGTKETIGPLRSDSTGGAWASFVPKQTGTYTLQMFYPGGVLVGGGNVFGGGGINWTGSVLSPSTSALVSLTVQADPIEMIYQTPPLPTEYWSRPIYGTNYDWAQLGGSWWGLRAPSFATTGMYDAMGNVQLYTTAPNTGHIVWTKPTHFGGMAGLPIANDQSGQYHATSIAINYFEPIILNGVLYYTQFAGANSKIVGWEAVDLHTGETVWTRTPGESGKEVLRMGQILRFHTVQEFGSAALLWSTENAGMFATPSFFSIYDAATGEYLANVTSVQNVPFLIDFSTEQQGTLLGHYTIGGNLTMWNSTRMLAGPTGPATTVRVSGNYNFTRGNQWSVPLPTTLDDVPIGGALSVAAITPEVILMRYAASAGGFQEMSFGYQITAGYDAKTGELLWGPLNQTVPYLHDMGLIAARDGVYVLHDKDAQEAYGYSLINGQKLWGPVKLPSNAWSSIARGGEIAYDKVFIWDYGGYVSALNPQTGEILWTFEPRSAGYDTPYGIYPLWHFGTHSICDGKIFFSEGSMYNPPIHPAYRLAIDCETGELVWSILSYSGRAPAAHADTYMVQWNSFDAQIYTFGKGQTATSLIASPKVSTVGSSVLIEGMVTDESPGTKNSDRVARFPNGVPAIADEFMSDWMEYVYMQQIKPTDTNGVPVKIFVTGPDGNTEHITTVTSDSNGIFYHQWTPPQTGAYKITAEFSGSESYFGSNAITVVAVDVASAPIVTIAPTQTPAPTETAAPTDAPTQTATPIPAVEPDSSFPTETLLIIGAAVIIIAIVAAAAVLLRKRA